MNARPGNNETDKSWAKSLFYGKCYELREQFKIRYITPMLNRAKENLNEDALQKMEELLEKIQQDEIDLAQFQRAVRGESAAKMAKKKRITDEFNSILKRLEM